MDNDLITRVHMLGGKFSKSQKMIAKYIEESYDKAAFMTASKLGESVGVSESTVVRFANELGYDGYPKLQLAMKEMIKNKLTSVQRIEVTSSVIGEGDVLRNVLNHDIDKIKRTIEDTSHVDFYKAVEVIANARKIYIIGARSAAALAEFLGFYFGFIFEDVRIIRATSDTEIYEQMFRITKDDVAIGISFPRYSKRAVRALNFASNRGAGVVALTDSPVSPLVKPSNYVLLARSSMLSMVDSLVAPLSMINALIVAIAQKKKNEVSDTFRQLEEIWDEYEVYEKLDGE